MSLELATLQPSIAGHARHGLDDASLALRAAFGGRLASRAALGDLAAIARVHRAAPRSVLIRREDPAHALWLLGSGRASVGGHDASGQWWQSRPVQAGEWIDVASAWRGGAYLETAIAETEVVAYELPIDAVDAVCRVYPDLWHRLLGCVAERVSRVTEGARDLVVKDVTARLAGWLLQALRKGDDCAGADAGEIMLRQHKRTLASQLGTSPETFSRTLRHLHERGLIDIDRYRIRVRDAEGLRRLLNGPSPREPARAAA